MVKVPYQLLLKETNCFRDFRAGDVLSKGFAGEIDLPEEAALAPWEPIFARHNRDDRPDGRMFRSLSVGDVVIAGEMAMACCAIGWEPLSADMIREALEAQCPQ